jgi:NitT/TauT family transport system substrate-binding protein
MQTLKIVAAVACIAIAAMPGQTIHADPVKIRVDWTVAPAQFAPLIPLVPRYAPDVYRHYGQSYVVEPLRLSGGGATLTALAAGDTDVSTLNPQALVLGVTNAELDLRVIGQQISTEIPGYLQTYFWVRKARIKTIDDLRGKVIGVNAQGSAPYAAAEKILLARGLRVSHDYQMIELPFPAQLPALKAGKIDAAVLVPPFSIDAGADPALAPMFSLGDAFGPLETSIWVAKARYVAQHRAALVDFLEDNIRMRRWMSAPRTRPDAVRLLSEVTKIPAKEYENWVYTHKDYYYDPDAMVDAKRLQRNVDDMNRAGIVPGTIDVSKYVDVSLVKEAAARLKN